MHTQKSCRFHHIDALESIAAFFVVLYHCSLHSTNILAESNPITYLNYFLKPILSTCVPLFFFANGYLLLKKDFDLKKHLLKIFRLTVLTVFWSILTLILGQVITGKKLIPFAFLHALRFGHEWLGYFWYMGALICIYLLFPLLKQAFDTNRPVFLFFTAAVFLFTFGNPLLNKLGTAAFALLGKEYVFRDWNFFGSLNPFREIYGFAFVYFCLGGLCADHLDQLLAIPAKRRNTVCAIGIVIASLLLGCTGLLYSFRTGVVWDTVWYGYDSISTLINTFCVFCLCLNVTKSYKPVQMISQNTLGIYLIHPYLNQLILPWISKVDYLCNIPCSFIYALILLCASLTLALILKRTPFLSKLL